MTLFNSYGIQIILITIISGLFACSNSNSNSVPGDKIASQTGSLQPTPVIVSVKDTPVKAATIVMPSPMPASMKKTAILNNKISFLLPSLFRSMTLKEYQVKYGMPSIERDKFVYTDNQLEANFMIHYTDEPVDSSAMEEIAQQLLTELKSISHYRYIKSGPLKADNRLLQIMEFEIETLDARSVSIIYFTVVDGKLLKGNFNFPSSLKNGWYNQALQTLQSIHIN